MPKIVCGNCSHILNISEISHDNEFDLLPADQVDELLGEVLEKTMAYPDLPTKIAIFSDLWAEKTQSFWRCPHCGSLILSSADGRVETYVKR